MRSSSKSDRFVNLSFDFDCFSASRLFGKIRSFFPLTVGHGSRHCGHAAAIAAAAATAAAASAAAARDRAAAAAKICGAIISETPLGEGTLRQCPIRPGRCALRGCGCRAPPAARGGRGSPPCPERGLGLAVSRWSGGGRARGRNATQAVGGRWSCFRQPGEGALPCGRPGAIQGPTPGGRGGSRGVTAADAARQSRPQRRCRCPSQGPGGHLGGTGPPVSPCFDLRQILQHADTCWHEYMY